MAREGLNSAALRSGCNEAALLSDIRTALIAHFGGRLEGLTVEAMDVLSGYYDRLESAGH